MSLSLIAIDKAGDHMFILTDRRTCRESDRSFISDDSVKIKVIKETLVYIGSSYSRVPDLVEKNINELSNKQPSEIIEFIKSWDKSFEREPGEVVDIQVKLAGIYDDGRLFYYLHQEDGSDEITFATPGKYSIALGSVDDTIVSKGQQYIGDAIKQNALSETLSLTCAYLSTISPMISPTHDKYLIQTKKS